MSEKWVTSTVAMAALLTLPVACILIEPLDEPRTGARGGSGGGNSGNTIGSAGRSGAAAGTGGASGKADSGNAGNAAMTTATVSGAVATGGRVVTGGAANAVIASGGLGVTGGAAGTTAESPPSCVNLAKCGTDSCCATIKMVGGTFKMGRSTDPLASDYYADAMDGRFDDEIPEHDATVAGFSLDKYEVTVGRFRRFVEEYDVWHKTDGNPKDNAGAYAKVPNMGWGHSWTATDTDLPVDATNLKDELTFDSFGNWTANAGTADAETFPINLVSWYEAFAFCLWDGGRLPTEAEWEYAAAGGNENRLYPWAGPEIDATRANYNLSSVNTAKKPVGSYPAGVSVFGHMDLAGSVYEWVFDWYSSTCYGTTEVPAVCSNCANTVATVTRVMRGGAWLDGAELLRTANRYDGTPAYRNTPLGFRCARTP